MSDTQADEDSPSRSLPAAALLAIRPVGAVIRAAAAESAAALLAMRTVRVRASREESR